MKMILKKTLAPIAGATAMVLFAVNKAFAQASGAIFQQTGAGITAAQQGDFATTVTNIINYFLGILGLVAVGFLIYAGVLMVTAGGNDDAISKAKKIITYAVIGIVIIILSWTIVSFVASALG
jgi:hypothetical protein